MDMFEGHFSAYDSSPSDTQRFMIIPNAKFTASQGPQRSHPLRTSAQQVSSESHQLRSPKYHCLNYLSGYG